MYSEILTNMDVESKDSKSSNNKLSQRAAQALQGVYACAYTSCFKVNSQDQSVSISVGLWSVVTAVAALQSVF